jgi:hypothetical protein
VRVLLYVLPLAFMLYALIDCAQDEVVERTSVPKWMWIMWIIVVPGLGAISWLVVAKIAKPLHPQRTFRGPFDPKSEPAPDDDPDFLRVLEERARRKKDPPPAAPGA